MHDWPSYHGPVFPPVGEESRLCHDTVTTNSTEQCYEPLDAAHAGLLLAAFEHAST